MKTVQDFLSSLTEKDVKLWIEDGNLRCSAPKGAITPSLKETLKNRKNEIIRALSEKDTPKENSATIIPVLSSRNDLPLSFAQQRLFFLDRLIPNISLYNIFLAIRIDGELNVNAMFQAFNEIVNRHEVLRTTFTMKNGRPAQIIKPSLEIGLPLKILGDLSY